MARVTEAELAQLHELLTEKRELDSRARDLGRQAKPLRDKVEEHLKTLKSGTIVRGAYRAVLARGRKFVPWKQHFVERFGPDEAERIEEGTEPSQSVKVEEVEG